MCNEHVRRGASDDRGLVDADLKSMVRPIFATLIVDFMVACPNLFGVVVGTVPRATMRFAPVDPVK